MIDPRHILTRDGNGYLSIEGKWVLIQGPLFTALRRHIIENNQPRHTFPNGDAWTQFNYQVSGEPLPRVGFVRSDGQLPAEGRYGLFL